MWKLLTFILATAICISTNAAEDYRLTSTIMPVHYDLRLQPYLLESDGSKRFTFDGEVTIEIQAKEETNQIVMHSLNLNYTERLFWEANGNETISLVEDNLNTVTCKITYNLQKKLRVGRRYFLKFVYTGLLYDDMLGFYRSQYTDQNGETKWIASTQFEPYHTRRAFPSFDEPKFKSTFQVTIVRPKHMNSFSNTRISITVPVGSGDLEQDIYLKTPKMSSYLLAFIVSEFQLRGDERYGVISRPEFYPQTLYAYEIGQQTLSELENYFNISYYTMGNDKIHMAAIPDFDAGAMENWGLLTYRETALIYDREVTTLSDQSYIAQVITHEQTHMWFGDYVTCDWWSYTWLNEGFARYFQYYATHNVVPQWELDKQFVTGQLQTVMDIDATSTTNPMSDENTNTPADLGRMFNRITYNKGGTFVRSLFHIMGEGNFRRALRVYLNERKYTNTVPENLFNHIIEYWPTEFNNYAQSYLETFTTTVGFPVLTIKLADDGQSFSMTQKRFLLEEGQGIPKPLYVLPITYTTDIEKDFQRTAPRFFLDKTDSPRTVKLNYKANWVLANIQETYYYRVNYDEKTWKALQQELYKPNWGGIHEINRAQMANDLLNLARVGEIGYDLVFEFLEYLSTESNYLPWYAAFSGLKYIQTRLGSDNENFAKYIRRLTENTYNSLGFEQKDSDTPFQILSRSLVLSWACKYQNEDCVTKAQNIFRKMNETPVQPNIRSAVYCTAMRFGDESDFNKLYQQFLKETNPTEIDVISTSLGCVKDQKLVEKWFSYILGETVRRQDRSSALSGLYSSNPENILPVFELITKNVDQVIAATSQSTAASAISSIAALFTENSQLEALRSFNSRSKTKFGEYATTLENAEKTVANNLNWSAEKLPIVKEYLTQTPSTIGSGGSSTFKFSFFSFVLLPMIARLLTL